MDLFSSMFNHHGKCAHCGKFLTSQLLYKYTQRTYVGTLDGTDLVVAFSYFVCSPCLFDLISAKKLREYNG